jgi:hypothetical protein
VAEDRNHGRLAGGPIATAIAVAILICAVPLAYRILQCEQFDSGFSLERWFSFKCERAVGPIEPEKPVSPPDTGNAPAGPAPSPESTVLTGYVYYEEKGRRPTGRNGVYLQRGTSSSPTYETIEQGAVLKTVRSSTVRVAPGGSEEPIGTISGGECVKVLQPPSRPTQGLRQADSGGWLMVQAVSCGR